MEAWIVILIIVAVLVLFMIFLMVVTRYKKCPPDKIMVIYGKVGADKDGNARSAKCIHGGAAFIWPLVQAFTYLDLTPLSISVDLKSALSRQNIRIDVPSIFTVGISTEPTVMENAAERLRNLKMNEIQELAKDIIFGQLRLVIATMNIEEINTDRDKFLEAISRNVEGELKKIGLRLINVNVTDISDESGYIIALGQEAAAKAASSTTTTSGKDSRASQEPRACARASMRASPCPRGLSLRGPRSATMPGATTCRSPKPSGRDGSAPGSVPRRRRASPTAAHTSLEPSCSPSPV